LGPRGMDKLIHDDKVSAALPSMPSMVDLALFTLYVVECFMYQYLTSPSTCCC
jgi:hypothetical protein